MRVIICGGGTAGHVTPGIAIADYVKKNSPASEIMFIGRSDGEENQMIKRAGYKYITLDVRGFKRSLSPKNISTLIKMLFALKKAYSELKSFKPDIVIGTGGYVCWPVIKAAQLMRIPNMIHESNAYPGLTTRVLSKTCDRVLLNYDDCKGHLKRQDNTLTVGNPLRGDFLSSTREAARRKLNIPSSEIFILSFGGSGGADIMNDNILTLMRIFSKPTKKIRHIHATGRKYFKKTQKDFPDLLIESYGCRAVPFINDMPTYMIASDIVISRAGAMTLSEISRSQVAPILIPSPNVTDNHQYKNAKAFENVGGAIVIEESELTPERLKEVISSLITNRKRREEIANNAKILHVEDSCKLIFSEMEKLTKPSVNKK